MSFRLQFILNLKNIFRMTEEKQKRMISKNCLQSCFWNKFETLDKKKCRLLLLKQIWRGRVMSDASKMQQNTIVFHKEKTAGNPLKKLKSLRLYG